MNLKNKKCEYCDNTAVTEEGGGYPPLCELHAEEAVNAINEYFAEIEEYPPEEFDKTFKKRYKDILA
jgi:hypothetical protein